MPNLIAQIQTNNDISSGISLSRSTRQGCGLIWNATHKISLYTDDVLIYLREPESSIPTLLETLTEYGTISRYKMHLSKSVVMPLNSAGTKIQRHNIPFQWRLDLWALRSSIYCMFKGLLSKLFIFNKTKNLPLSLMGQIKIIKISVLPKFHLCSRSYSSQYLNISSNN